MIKSNFYTIKYQVRKCSFCGEPIIETHYFQDACDGTLAYHKSCLENAGYVKKNQMYIRSVYEMNGEKGETEAITKQYDDYTLMAIINLLKEKLNRMILKEEKQNDEM